MNYKKGHITCNQSGFTLLEIMVVAAIIAIGAGLAVSGFNSWIPRNQVKSVTQKLRAEMHKAKLEAVKRNDVCLVTFTGVSGTNPGSFRACFGSTDDDCDDAGDQIVAQFNLAGNSDYRHAEIGDASSAFTDGGHFRFNARGMPESDSGGFSSGTVNINCSSDPNYSLSIILSPTGRIRIQ